MRLGLNLRVLMMMLLASCSDPTVHVVEEGELPEFVVVTESFLQRPLPALDLLFVIDNTRSMQGTQEALSDSIEPFISSLETSTRAGKRAWF